MLCRGDSVGVFQVESRAQMATLPRLQPRCFYDLVVEVALIRPGPIQGGSVHPYIRRRNGFEPVTYLHPIFERCLAKTLGVPLFQEQLMEMAIDAAGFSAAEADQLRQAMGSKRSADRMERLRSRLFGGMAERGITGDIAEEIWDKLRAFANFGFPESHSVSFAYLVYVSAWLKLRYPAAFLASLLNSQPMGFWAPHTLVADARRHGVSVLGPDVNRSEAVASLEPTDGDGPLVRLGITSVKGIGSDLAEQIAGGRPYATLEEVARRTGANRTVLESLATAGALSSLDVDPANSANAAAGHGRREALWAAGAAAESRPDRIPGVIVGTDAPTASTDERRRGDGSRPADTWLVAALVTDEPGPRRARAPGCGADLGPHGRARGAKVTIAGIVTHRQRPATAGGVTFLTSRTRQASSTSSARQACGCVTGGLLAPPSSCSYAAASNGPPAPTPKPLRGRTSSPSTWRRLTA